MESKTPLQTLIDQIEEKIHTTLPDTVLNRQYRDTLYIAAYMAKDLLEVEKQWAKGVWGGGYAKGENDALSDVLEFDCHPEYIKDRVKDRLLGFEETPTPADFPTHYSQFEKE